MKFGQHEITDEQWWAFCDQHAAKPIPLAEADLAKPFVYSRKYGVMYVPSGYHQQVMAMLYAWEHGFVKAYHMMDSEAHDHLKETSQLADKFLEELPGTAFRSSVGKCVVAGKREHLTMIEKRFFGEIKYTTE